MAQIKPNSSLPTAVTICGLFFPSCEKFSVTEVQSILRFPADLFNLLAQPDLSFQQVSAAPRPELIGPGGFNDHTSQVSVARLGNAAAVASFSTRELARNETAVAHQLRCLGEARDRAEFRHDRYRRYFCNTAKRLQGCDDRTHAWRRRPCRFMDRRFQSFDSSRDVFDLMDVIGDHHFLSRLVEMDFHLDPL